MTRNVSPQLCAHCRNLVVPLFERKFAAEHQEAIYPCLRAHEEGAKYSGAWEACIHFKRVGVAWK